MSGTRDSFGRSAPIGSFVEEPIGMGRVADKPGEEGVGYRNGCTDFVVQSIQQCSDMVLHQTHAHLCCTIALGIAQW